MAFMGIPITMLSMILPAFIVCVGLGDSVHLISIFRDTLVRGDQDQQSRKIALIQAIGSTAKPIVYTSLTTMIGLFSFRFASLEGIQQMGTSGAIGVLAACLHSLLFFASVFKFSKKKYSKCTFSLNTESTSS
jgi:predicted RND superfamily exporter protein